MASYTLLSALKSITLERFQVVSIVYLSKTLNELSVGVVMNIEMVKVFFSGDESSYVNVRIHDGIIDGCFYTQDELYHVEPASKHFKQSVPFHSLVYRSSEVHFNSSKLKVMAHQVNHQAHVKPVHDQSYNITL